MGDYVWEGKKATVEEDGEEIVIRCDRRTANYIAVKLYGDFPPVLKELRQQLDHILTGAPRKVIANGDGSVSATSDRARTAGLRVGLERAADELGS